MIYVVYRGEKPIEYYQNAVVANEKMKELEAASNRVGKWELFHIYEVNEEPLPGENLHMCVERHERELELKHLFGK